jgi:hypothetical protein
MHKQIITEEGNTWRTHTCTFIIKSTEYMKHAENEKKEKRNEKEN